MNNILIIDDERDICETVKMILDYEGYNTDLSTSPIEGLEKLRTKTYDAVFLDIQMNEMNGYEVLTQALNFDQNLNIIIISAYGNIENAIKATKLGAFDFLEKPIDRDKMLMRVRNAVAQSVLKRENEEIKKSLIGDSEILGNSIPIKAILNIIEKVAPTDARVMITGENGTGKELVARAIHRQSERRNKPLIEVNCAAIPNELIESELFGHEKGSFTGAMQLRIGKFELADKGTLFLDEIGDMSLQAQAKVLRAIEDGKIERVGGNKKIPCDVRIITATNKILSDEIKANNFREDLFHRLNVIPIKLPPLRERGDDVLILISAFATQISNKLKRLPPLFSHDALDLLKRLKWSGNVRELRNTIERIIILTTSRSISALDIQFLVPNEKVSVDEMITQSNSFQDFKEKAEKAFILKQLDSNNWNISKTAEILEIQRSHLYNKMKKYGIDKEEN